MIQRLKKKEKINYAFLDKILSEIIKLQINPLNFILHILNCITFLYKPCDPPLHILKKMPKFIHMQFTTKCTFYISIFMNFFFLRTFRLFTIEYHSQIKGKKLQYYIYIDVYPFHEKKLHSNHIPNYKS